jgi:hypothetical protein
MYDTIDIKIQGDTTYLNKGIATQGRYKISLQRVKQHNKTWIFVDRGETADHIMEIEKLREMQHV